MKNDLSAVQVIDSLWLLEKNGQKVGFIQESEDGITIKYENRTEKFDSPEELKQKYSITFEHPRKSKSKEHVVHGFPTDSEPFNDIYDLSKRLPMFTHDQRSKSYFCAGYYLVNLDKGWTIMFCPKLLMLARYKFRGPFRTEVEASYNQ